MITLLLMILLVCGMLGLIMVGLARVSRWWGWACLAGAAIALVGVLWWVPVLVIDMRGEW